MTDEVTREVYARASLGGNLPRGSRPAVVVVDLSCGFTDPSFPLGGDLHGTVEETGSLLNAARAYDHPVFFTTIGYQEGANDVGIWRFKGPDLARLEIGTRWVEIDPRLERQQSEPIIVKTGASAFFGTALASLLINSRVDTVVLCGATTSGCVRATAVDLMQFGWPTLVPRECVGDRAPAPHEASLFDMQAKYADVVALSEVITYFSHG